MKLIILGLILFIEKQVPVETKELWRDDGKCGEKNKLPSGKPGECNPKETGLMNGPCCSEYGFCGNTESHCDCPKCVNYSQEEKDGDGSLPAKFLGTYKRTKQTGLDDLMYALGIDWFKRKVECISIILILLILIICLISCYYLILFLATDNDTNDDNNEHSNDHGELEDDDDNNDPKADNNEMDDHDLYESPPDDPNSEYDEELMISYSEDEEELMIPNSEDDEVLEITLIAEDLDFVNNGGDVEFVNNVGKLSNDNDCDDKNDDDENDVNGDDVHKDDASREYDKEDETRMKPKTKNKTPKKNNKDDYDSPSDGPNDDPNSEDYDSPSDDSNYEDDEELMIPDSEDDEVLEITLIAEDLEFVENGSGLEFVNNVDELNDDNDCDNKYEGDENGTKDDSKTFDGMINDIYSVDELKDCENEDDVTRKWIMTENKAPNNDQNDDNEYKENELFSDSEDAEVLEIILIAEDKVDNLISQKMSKIDRHDTTNDHEDTMITNDEDDEVLAKNENKDNDTRMRTKTENKATKKNDQDSDDEEDDQNETSNSGEHSNDDNDNKHIIDDDDNNETCEMHNETDEQKKLGATKKYAGLTENKDTEDCVMMTRMNDCNDSDEEEEMMKPTVKTRDMEAIKRLYECKDDEKSENKAPNEKNIPQKLMIDKKRKRVEDGGEEHKEKEAKKMRENNRRKSAKLEKITRQKSIAEMMRIQAEAQKIRKTKDWFQDLPKPRTPRRNRKPATKIMTPLMFQRVKFFIMSKIPFVNYYCMTRP